MTYMLGGYYLVRLHEIDFGRFKGAKVFTGSDCLNTSFFKGWALSWTEDGKNGVNWPKEEFNLSEADIQRIQKWADPKFEAGKIGWPNVFQDLATLMEFKTQFFGQEQEYQILSIYLEQEASIELIEEFKPQSKQTGSIGLRDNLMRNQAESDNPYEELIGYDLIGIEYSGGFHSFHCHDLGEDLSNRFNIEINDFGLIHPSEKLPFIPLFMNDLNNGFEPVPWYLAKVKRINEALFTQEIELAKGA